MADWLRKLQQMHFLLRPYQCESEEGYGADWQPADLTCLSTGSPAHAEVDPTRKLLSRATQSILCNDLPSWVLHTDILPGYWSEPRGS